VLNVDDRPSALYVRNRLLRRSGFVAADAATGAVALARAVALKPNAILLDIHLPDCDGRDLCQTMRRDSRLQQIPVVLVSATVQANELINPVAVGAAAFLREPVSAGELASTAPACAWTTERILKPRRFTQPIPQGATSARTRGSDSD